MYTICMKKLKHAKHRHIHFGPLQSKSIKTEHQVRKETLET